MAVLPAAWVPDSDEVMVVDRSVLVSADCAARVLSTAELLVRLLSFGATVVAAMSSCTTLMGARNCTVVMVLVPGAPTVAAGMASSPVATL